jgi:hypothetical protein
MNLFKKYYQLIVEEETAEDRYRRKKGLPPLEKISPYEKLEKYKDDPDVYISFRDTKLIGINPQTRYTSTPNAIYTYPLKILWKDFSHIRGEIVVPFVNNFPYIFVIKVKSNARELNFTKYSKDDYEKDIQKIIKSKKISIENLNELIKKAEKEQKYYLGKKNYYGTLIWNIVSEIVINPKKINPHAIIQERLTGVWNRFIYNILNYDYVVDEGYGIIHSSEKTQALFINNSVFKVIDIIDNKFNIKREVAEKQVWISGKYPDTVWENGVWYNGTFETEDNFYFGNGARDFEDKLGIKDHFYRDKAKVWKKGVWKNGNFIRSYWRNGIWKKGFFKKSNWEKGIWEYGTMIDSNWQDGIWHNGNSINSYWGNGIWHNGKWKSSKKVLKRLYGKFHTPDIIEGNAFWEFGYWEKGVWLDGVWSNGQWKDGTWKDGVFIAGDWYNGTWKDGIWKEDATWHKGIWKDGIWEGGTWHDGTWEGGTWLGGEWLGGYDKKRKYHPEGDSPDKWKEGYGHWINLAKISPNSEYMLDSNKIDIYFKRGDWYDGTWKGGIWRGDTWHKGTFEKGDWQGKTWKDGIWKDGTWYSGNWEGGVWLGGYDKKGNYHPKGDSPDKWNI